MSFQAAELLKEPFPLPIPPSSCHSNPISFSLQTDRHRYGVSGFCKPRLQINQIHTPSKQDTIKILLIETIFYFSRLTSNKKVENNKWIVVT